MLTNGQIVNEFGEQVEEFHFLANNIYFVRWLGIESYKSCTELMAWTNYLEYYLVNTD